MATWKLSEAEILILGCAIIFVVWVYEFLRRKKYRKLRRKRKKERSEQYKLFRREKKRAKKRQERKRFGLFKCRCGRKWESAFVWEYIGKDLVWKTHFQECKKCHRELRPYKTEKLKIHHFRKQFRKHKTLLCGMCHKLIHSCVKY